MNFKKLIMIGGCLMLSACSGPIHEDKNTVGSGNDTNTYEQNPDFIITGIQATSNGINISGSGFNSATGVKIKQAGVTYETNIVTKNNGTISANFKSNLTLIVGMAFELIISSAHADTVYSATFDISNNSIAITKLQGALSGTGVSSGQTIVWNGSAWVPQSISS